MDQNKFKKKKCIYRYDAVTEISMTKKQEITGQKFQSCKHDQSGQCVTTITNRSTVPVH